MMGKTREQLEQENKVLRVLLSVILDHIDNMIDKCQSPLAWAQEMKRCLQRGLKEIENE